METHVVNRKFTGPGSVELLAGTKIDASNWKNLDPLVSSNYLRPLNANEVSTSITDAPRKRGRQLGSKNKAKIPVE